MKWIILCVIVAGAHAVCENENVEVCAFDPCQDLTCDVEEAQCQPGSCDPCEVTWMADSADVTAQCIAPLTKEQRKMKKKNHRRKFIQKKLGMRMEKRKQWKQMTPEEKQAAIEEKRENMIETWMNKGNEEKVERMREHWAGKIARMQERKEQVAAMTPEELKAFLEEKKARKMGQRKAFVIKKKEKLKARKHIKKQARQDKRRGEGQE
ncbi:hypothetical protein MAR_017071 [Mya arenaria]|uniref:Uncharacterized protein n=1 Tax=Mya arenaria TaxID=6604 RepID=A0ABY7EAP9_MYAAR|nr:uncharacterized protein LOC128236640 [Mya arenaria]WAR07113.1 hypothetical protein MAR_017071 [Mya arenaria]